MDISTSFSPVSIHCINWFNQLTIITFGYARDPVFRFIVYDIIHRRKAALGCSLLVKSGMWEKTKELIREITHAQLITIATKRKDTNWCTNIAILALERYVQIVPAYVLHLYVWSFEFWLQLKAIMVTNGMLIFYIIINPADLQCLLIIYLTSIKLELSNKIQSIFWCKTATMNPITIAKFFNIICDAIFIFLFDVGQTERGLLGPVSNYFGTIETKGYRMLPLYCLVWLKSVSYLATLQI